METVLIYVTFVLVFMVFRITVLKNRDMYGEIEIKTVEHPLARTFLRIRRTRVIVGLFTLYCCAGRFIGYYIIIPIINACMRLFSSEIRYQVELADTWELCFIAILCTLVLGLYVADWKIENRMLEEFSEKE